MVEEKWFPIGNSGRRLRAGVRKGEEEGAATLVLLHGVTRRWQDWEPIIPYLDRRWNVVSFDHCGHGESDRMEPTASGDRYLVVNYANDLSQVLRHFSGPLVLVGHSLGGMVAAILAGDFPDQVVGLVLEDPPFSTMGSPIIGSSWETLFRGMHEVCVRAGSLEQMTSNLGKIEIKQSDGQIRQLQSLRTQEALRWGAYCLKDLDPDVLVPVYEGRWLQGVDLDVVARSVQSPTILLQADLEAGGALTDSDADRFSQLAHRCERVRFPGKGHQLHGTIPKEVAEIINQFCRG